MSPSMANEDQIRRRAFEIFTSRGGRHGNAMDDWLQAEREIKMNRKVDTGASPTQRNSRPRAAS